MATIKWKPFLEQWSKAVLSSENVDSFELTQSAAQTGWLGHPAATEDQIAAVETRLGKPLPPSYRQFLQITNGWQHTGNFIGRLWPVEMIDWLRTLNPALINLWIEALDYFGDIEPLSDEAYFVYGEQQIAEEIRPEHLRGALQISAPGIDQEIFLLNPEVINADGEWEAWFFASWVPGAYRFPSFWEMMQYEYRSLLDQQDHESKRAKSDDELAAKLPTLLAELQSKADMYQPGNDPVGEVYREGIQAGYAEAMQQIQELQQTYETPGELRAALLDLAGEFEHRARDFPAAMGNLGGLLGNLSKMLKGIGDGGKTEGYRQAAGVIHWFLGEN